MERTAVSVLRFVAWVYAVGSLLVVLLGLPNLGAAPTAATFAASAMLEGVIFLQALAVWALLLLVAACAERYLATHAAPARNTARWVQTTTTADPSSRD